MIVYVESNFVVEIALEQEQLSSAEAILTLAEQKEISLAFPNFILSETFERIMRERRERNILYNNLAKALTNLQRSEPHKNIMFDMEPVIKILKEAHFRQLERLHLTFERLFAIGECVSVNAACFRDALVYQQQLGLEPQDSIIYTTILADLLTRPQDEKKCFLSRDRRAFDKERSIKAELALHNCSYIGSFADGMKHINSLKKPGAG
jgi:predicted nucleic acid-binding protein